MTRSTGWSVRLKLTLSYAGFLLVAGIGLISVVWVFLLRYVPDQAISLPYRRAPGDTFEPGLFIPGRNDLWAAFAPKAGLMLALLLVFGLVGGWILAGRMLAPLNRITDATRRVGDGELSHRIQLSGPHDEFRELGDAFDGMVARLEAEVEEQQRFTANASHELRTPLAITQALVEVARNDHDRDTTRLLDALHDVNSRAIALTEALLLMSRAERRSFTREQVDLSLVAEEATEALLPLAEKHHVVIECTGDVARTSGSRALLVQLATNLVHNAIVHNVSDRGAVWVSTRNRQSTSVLIVENTGDELDPTTVSTLSEPFRRGTERIHTDQAGAGLGLAIVKSISEAHGGSLVLEPRSDGGLRVTVELPRFR